MMYLQLLLYQTGNPSGHVRGETGTTVSPHEPYARSSHVCSAPPQPEVIHPVSTEKKIDMMRKFAKVMRHGVYVGQDEPTPRDAEKKI